MTEPRIYELPIRNTRHRHYQPTISNNYAAYNRPITELIQSSTGSRISEAFGHCEPHPSYYEAEWSEPSTETESDSEASAQERDYYWQQFYQDQRLELQKLSTGMFRGWCATVRYSAPPGARVPHRNSTRTLHRGQCIVQTEEEEDVSDAELVVVSHQRHFQGFFHLACPFYIYAPKRHHSCLKNRLQSAEGMIDHLIHCHSLPSYCPICYRMFNTLMERDSHILNETCKRRDPNPSDGLNEDQKVLLIQETYLHLDDKRRWHQIWDIIFPKSRQPRSPYLDEGCGLMASMVKDFWDIYGHQIITDFLDNQNVSANETFDAHGVLYDFALNDLLDGIIREQTVWRS
ncbi:hypothetical protein ACHAPA_009658 [Fusarium lateritium]